MKSLGLKIVCVLLMCVAMMGCRPRGVLSNREMRDVLYDLHLTDGAIQVAGYIYSHDEEVAGYYKNVLDKHGITQAEFDSSLVWYTDNPQIFNKIYPKVIARLEKDLAVTKVLRDAEQAKKSNKKPSNSSKPHIPLRDLLEVEKEWQKGYENPWKIWKSEDFCEKDVIIFGQLGAGDALASTDTLVTSRAPISSLEGTQPPRSYGR